jgi:hypothetical protein
MTMPKLDFESYRFTLAHLWIAFVVGAALAMIVIATATYMTQPYRNGCTIECPNE